MERNESTIEATSLSFLEQVLALEIQTSLENQLQSTIDRIRNDSDESKKLMLDEMNAARENKDFDSLLFSFFDSARVLLSMRPDLSLEEAYCDSLMIALCRHNTEKKPIDIPYELVCNLLENSDLRHFLHELFRDIFASQVNLY